jgi:hypothetical protein
MKKLSLFEIYSFLYLLVGEGLYARNLKEQSWEEEVGKFKGKIRFLILSQNPVVYSSLPPSETSKEFFLHYSTFFIYLKVTNMFTSLIERQK